MRDFDGGGAVEKEIMEIIEKKLSEITPYENNPRRNDDAVEYVANSIREFGWKVPIVIDRDGVIIAGHTRYKAAQKLGYDTVPCIMADDLTPEQVKAYRLADNKVSEFAEWDFDLLAAELDEIDLDMSEFGFEPEDLDESEEIPDRTNTGCTVRIVFDDVRLWRKHEQEIRSAVDSIDGVKVSVGGNDEDNESKL